MHMKINHRPGKAHPGPFCKNMKTIEFTDKNGNIIHIPAHWTIKDLIAKGFRGIGMVKPEEPMKEGEFRSKESNEPA